MKLTYGALSVLCLALLGAYAWKPIRVQTYLIPSTVKPGWVAVEYENPNCAPLKEGRFWQDHVIPTSGYLCTSSLRETRWVYREYYLVQPNGERRLLTVGKEISKEITNYLDPLNPSCKVIADTF